jgi:hypothetical protein
LLADSTAVQLTRNPDALARAIVRLADTDVEPSGVNEIAYLFAVWTKPEKEALMRRRTIPVLMPMHPVLRQRLERLHALGASIDPEPYRGPGLPFSRTARILFVYPFGLILLALFFGALLLMMAISVVVMMAVLMALWYLFQLIFATVPGARG